MGIRWLKIKGNSELWEATGEKHIILPITMRKWLWIEHTLRNGDESIGKTSIGLESTGSQKEMKTESNLKKDRFRRNRKMWQIWSEVKNFTGTGFRWRCFTNMLCS
jgi:hypothetical protein